MSEKTIYEASWEIRKIIENFDAKEKNKILEMIKKEKNSLNTYNKKWELAIERQRKDEKQYPLMCCCGEKVICTKAKYPIVYVMKI